MEGLKRSVTFWEALSINISAIIGAGIFTVSGVAAGLAGPSSVLAVILTFWTLIIITFYYVLLRAERERLGIKSVYKKGKKKRNW
ncbi:MAG: hypothetical protein RXO35_00275 [Candidatus Micrarchaeota archaeon]